MSLPVVFHADAEDDLNRIEEYLALRFSARNADLYCQRIVAACIAIGLAPYRGNQRDDIRPGVRATGFEKRVTITFEVEQSQVVILGVWYAGRLPH